VPQIGNGETIANACQLIDALAALQAEEMDAWHARQVLEGAQWQGTLAVPAIARAPLPDDADLHATRGSELAPPVLDALRGSTEIRPPRRNGIEHGSEDPRQAHEWGVDGKCGQSSIAGNQLINAGTRLQQGNQSGLTFHYYHAASGLHERRVAN